MSGDGCTVLGNLSLERCGVAAGFSMCNHADTASFENAGYTIYCTLRGIAAVVCFALLSTGLVTVIAHYILPVAKSLVELPHHQFLLQNNLVMKTTKSHSHVLTTAYHGIRVNPQQIRATGHRPHVRYADVACSSVKVRGHASAPQLCLDKTCPSATSCYADLQHTSVQLHSWKHVLYLCGW